MNFDIFFFINATLLGVGLAMDAFSVSVSNALYEQKMSFFRMNVIAGCYGFFQFLMPLLGWLCIHLIIEFFSVFNFFVPWIALVMLLYIGGKMIWSSLHSNTEEKQEGRKLTYILLLMQGIATSIDALSVGFTIADYDFLHAFFASLNIALVTHLICFVGLKIGKIVGNRIGSKAEILGGIILIGIGIEIWIKNLFFNL